MTDFKVIETIKVIDSIQDETTDNFEQTFYGNKQTGPFIVVNNFNNDVKIVNIFDKNRVLSEYRRLYKNQLHSDHFDNPALIEYVNGKVSKKRWFKNGKLHRENDKPAFVIHRYNDKGKDFLIRQDWYIDGKQHRDNDKPASIRFYDNNTMWLESYYWYRDGMLHRDEGAAIIHYYDMEGLVKESEIWLKNGLYVEDKESPNSISYYKNGKKKCEHWMENGNHGKKTSSRIDKSLPISFWYDEDGNITDLKMFSEIENLV